MKIKYKTKLLFCFLSIISITGLLISRSLLSNQSLDSRIKAATVTTIKVYPISGENYSSTIPASNPGAFVNFIKDNSSDVNIPDSVYVGLYLPKGGTCGDNKVNCLEIQSQSSKIKVTSCVKLEFKSIQNSPLFIRYKQTKEDIGSHTCQGDWCTTSPGMHLFSSSDGSVWSRQTNSLPTSWLDIGNTKDSDEKYKTISIKLSDKYKYVLLCRASGGSGRASILINSVYTENSISLPSINSNNDKFTIFVASDGNDVNDGLSRITAIKSLTQAQKILAKNKPQKNVEIRISKGTYYDSNISWKYYNSNYSISFLPENYIIGSSFDSNLMPIFDGKNKSSWMLRIWIAEGKPTNIRFYNLKIQNYINGISLSGNRNNKNKWNGNNYFYGIFFENIGTKWLRSDTLAVAAIDMVNSRNNTVEKCIFKSTMGDAHIHGLYLAHYSINNIIKNNTFSESTGAYIKTRDDSGNNIISENTFNYISTGAFLDDYCDHTENGGDRCTKVQTLGVIGECPSWNNTITNNILKGFSQTNWSRLFHEGEIPAWCTTPTKGSLRIINKNNILR